jgi:hypothetical protein
VQFNKTPHCLGDFKFMVTEKTINGTLWLIMFNKTPAQAFTLALRLVKYHRNILKDNLKLVDVLCFLTAVTS